MGRRFCAGSELPGCVALRNGLPPGNSLPAQSRAFTAAIWAGARAHIGRRGAWRASGWCMQIDLASLAGAGVNWGVHAIRKDPSPCSVRFPDGVGCGRRRADL